MKELSVTITFGMGNEAHNHDLEYRETLEHVHAREDGVVELLPYRPYRNQINELMRPYIDEYNAETKRAAVAGGLFATDIKGVTHYGGVYEDDGVYDAFITQGAKKYAYTENGRLHITVSGVGKKAGAAALEKAGGLEKFRSGFVFHNCGKTESIYNDKPFGRYNVAGHVVEITRNVYIHEQDYTLGRSDEYTEIINLSKYDINKICRHLENLLY